MKRRTTPPEFAGAGFFGEFHSSDGKSWRGPCPSCGGHRRFLVFTDREYPYWNYLCSCCGYRGMLRDLLSDEKKRPSKEDIERWKVEREREAQEKKLLEEEAMLRFLEMRIWEIAHKQLEPKDYEWWLRRGVDHSLVDFWRLGTVDRRFHVEGSETIVPTYTIPKYQIGGGDTPKNCDFRLLTELPNLGKYMGIKNLPPAVFVAQPWIERLSQNGEVFIVEGSIKAMVLHKHLGEKRQVIGVPSSRSWVNVVELVHQAAVERVYVMLDPDAASASLELAREIGKSARALTLPVKIDDAFNQYGLTVRELEVMLRQARTV